MKRYLYILFALIIITGCSKAQQLISPAPVGALQGTVSPNIQATIAVYQGDTKIQQITADPANGEFDITELATNEYTLEISAPNYQPAQKSVTITEGEVSYVSVLLTPLSSPVPEPPVVIPPSEPQPPSFAAGEIIVGFKDNVTLEEAQAVVGAYGLSGEFRDTTWKMFSFWLRADAGKASYIISRLEESSMVLWAEERCGAGNILVQFNLLATEETARDLVKVIGNAEITSTIRPPKGVLVYVPVGEEQAFVNRFQTSEKVKYAELNHIVQLCNVL